MQYEILIAESTNEMQLKVATAIMTGWKPLGGIAAICSSTDVVRFFQAMVK